MAGGIMVHFSETEKPLRSRQGFNVHLLNHSQLMHMTGFTKTGTLNMDNRKPYRSKALKAEARHNAEKCSDGVFRSTTRVQYHKKSGQH